MPCTPERAFGKSANTGANTRGFRKNRLFRQWHDRLENSTYALTKNFILKSRQPDKGKRFKELCTRRMAKRLKLFRLKLFRLKLGMKRLKLFRLKLFCLKLGNVLN
jgi:hypothetical protein